MRQDLKKLLDKDSFSLFHRDGMEWFEDFIKYYYVPNFENIKIDEAISLKQKNFPKRLFKFRINDSISIKNLRDNTLWLAKPSSFNDPYDCHLCIDEISHQLQTLSFCSDFFTPDDYLQSIEDVKNGCSVRFLLDRKYPNQEYKKKQGIEKLYELDRTLQNHIDAIEQKRDTSGVCALSENLESPLMWAHYADQHRGFCIEYDFSESHTSYIELLHPVIYQVDMFDPNDFYLDRDESKNPFVALLVNTIKSDYWSYEREWRFVRFEIKDRLIKVPKPKAVYLGSHIVANTNSDKEKAEIYTREIKTICTNQGIPIYQMRHSRSDFKMLADRIV